jgi:hypothetical protein
VNGRIVYPPPAHPLESGGSRPSAHLKLPDSVPQIGQGSHADAYQVHPTLDERSWLVTHQLSSEAGRPATVRVTAKIPSVDDADLAMLEHEARMYNGFPKHLSQYRRISRAGCGGTRNGRSSKTLRLFCSKRENGGEIE